MIAIEKGDNVAWAGIPLYADGSGPVIQYPWGPNLDGTHVLVAIGTGKSALPLSAMTHHNGDPVDCGAKPVGMSKAPPPPPVVTRR